MCSEDVLSVRESDDKWVAWQRMMAPHPRSWQRFDGTSSSPSRVCCKDEVIIAVSIFISLYHSRRAEDLIAFAGCFVNRLLGVGSLIGMRLEHCVKCRSLIVCGPLHSTIPVLTWDSFYRRTSIEEILH